MGNYHVRFCTGGGAGDCPTDRSGADALRATSRVALGLFVIIVGQRRPPTPRAAQPPAVRPGTPKHQRSGKI